MQIKTCKLCAEEVIKVLEAEESLILATCAGNRVTVHPMSHVNDGLTVYFQTGKDYLKTRQIRENHNVALCAGTYQIEGTATEIGHPMADENGLFAKLMKEKHPGSFAKYSQLEDEVVIKVTITRVRQYRYMDGEPLMAEAEFGGNNDERKYL